MSVSLVNNLGSLNTQSKVNATTQKLNQTIQRLSSGLRINSSGDDAAGLAIANKYRSDIQVLKQGVRNANDGLSALQTVDGGLNTISNLLDRASVLSGQSASDTFTGNRDTLQQEFSKVLDEISRQAKNIGLIENGANNKSLTTIIGGGSDSFAAAGTSNGVQIDLSGAANRVDATSLGLNALNIGATTGSVSASGGIDFRTGSLTANETLTFQKVGATGSLETFTVSFTAGQTGNSALAQLQNDSNLKAAGITASTDASGNLKFESANFFTVKSSAAAALQTGIGTSVRINSAANSASLTGAASTAAGTQAFDFTIGSSGAIERVNVSGGVGDTAATNASDIVAAINANTTLRDAGIFAIDVDGAGSVRVVSTKSTFALNVEAATASGAAVVTQSAGSQTVTAGSGNGGAAGAKAALDAIRAAVTNLGKVQGSVGAGQNRLQQAIELATSQIINFQAAESRVRDADIGAEASELARLTTLQQAGVAALAQANQASQAILSLLR